MDPCCLVLAATSPLSSFLRHLRQGLASPLGGAPNSDRSWFCMLHGLHWIGLMFFLKQGTQETTKIANLLDWFNVFSLVLDRDFLWFDQRCQEKTIAFGISFKTFMFKIWTFPRFSDDFPRWSGSQWRTKSLTPRRGPWKFLKMGQSLPKTWVITLYMA
jgi:hypothetical protein